MSTNQFNAADKIQDLQYFGEFGGVNPSISDSSTYTFLSAKTMFDTFEGNAEGCYLYSRHSSPMNLYLAQALAKMEGTEAANVTASGMGAITSTLLQICKSGDHIVSARTIYGGTYAFLKNFLPPFNIETSFVDINNFEAIENAIKPNTKVIYCESVSNPLLEVADLRKLSEICKKYNLKLIEDLKSKLIDVIFVYSKRAADQLLKIILNHKIENNLDNCTLNCISINVANTLKRLRWKKIKIFSPGDEELSLL